MNKRFWYAILATLGCIFFACQPRSSRRYTDEEMKETIMLINQIPYPQVMSCMDFDPEVISSSVEINSDEKITEIDSSFDNSEWIKQGKAIKNIEECILTLLEKDSPEIHRSSAVISLQYFGSARSIPLLIKLLSDDDRVVASDAAQALGILKAKSAVPILSKMAIHDKDWHCRLAACIALSAIGGEPAIKILRQALHDNDEIVSGFAKSALEKIEKAGDSSGGVPPIVESEDGQ